MSHSFSPLSDHKKIILKLADQQKVSTVRGYSKINNALLKDDDFNNSIKSLIAELFSDSNKECITKWEFFKYKSRCIAIERCRKMRADLASI